MTETRELRDDYLRRLEDVAADLPVEIRSDLLADIGSHIDELVRRNASEAELRNALDRLGSPEMIAAEARGDANAMEHLPHTPRPAMTTSPAWAVATVATPLFGPLMLAMALAWISDNTALGFIGAVAGRATGLGMLWSSPLWTRREKTIATLVWPGGFTIPAALGTMVGQVCSSVQRTAADGTIVAQQSCTGVGMPAWLGTP